MVAYLKIAIRVGSSVFSALPVMNVERLAGVHLRGNPIAVEQRFSTHRA
jgi:hypothetical protein